MIIKNNKEIIARYKGTKAIVAVYKNNHLIWELITSCFGKGMWIDDNPWTDDIGWCD